MRLYRTVWKWLIPAFLQEDQGELVQWTLGLFHDIVRERMRQVAFLGLPSECVSDALPLHGQARAIPRGLFEPERSYRQRLIGWRHPRGHKVRGSALALLEQVAAALRGTRHLTIDARGTQYENGVATPALRGVVWNWDGAEGASIGSQWGRYWIVVKSTGARWPTFTNGAWGPTIKTPGVVVGGSGIHPGEVSAVRKLTSNGRLGWTPAGRRAIYLTIYFDGDPFPVPDGTWDSWANRDLTYRYVPLHASVT
jgi:hypothetical protein